MYAVYGSEDAAEPALGQIEGIGTRRASGKVADTCRLRAKRTTSSATFSCRLANTFTAKHAISASVSADPCRRRGRPSAAADGRAPGAHRPRLAACRRTCLRQLLGALQTSPPAPSR